MLSYRIGGKDHIYIPEYDIIDNVPPKFKHLEFYYGHGRSIINDHLLFTKYNMTKVPKTIYKVNSFQTMYESSSIMFDDI